MSLFGNQNFYFGTIRKMVAYFGTVFNEINIHYTDSTGDVTKSIKIPLEYGPKNKMLARFDADPNINRPAALVTPRMSFKLENLSYVHDRKLGDWMRYIRTDSTDANKMRRNFQPVAYDFGFTLWVTSKDFEEGTKIVEQILPFFTPAFTSTVHLLPEMEIIVDIPIVLDSVTHEDLYEGNLTERRSVVWTLNFRVLSMLFGPTVSKPIIKFSNTNVLIGNTSTTNTVVSSIQVKPGLDANGAPTTNASLSVNTSIIQANDDWGYIEIPSGPNGN